MNLNKKKLLFSTAFLFVSSSFFIIYQNFIGPMNITNEAPQCDQAKLEEILALPSADMASVEINCSIQLKPNDIVRKQIVFHGSEAKNIVFDCDGANIVSNGFFTNQEVLVVRSRLLAKLSNGLTTWSRPQNIEIKNCNLNGSVRIIGMDRNGEGTNLRASSRVDEQHTQRAQAAAPRDIVFDNLVFKTTSTPVYVGPGSTKISIMNSLFTAGNIGGAAIYLDAESAQNRILNNTFDIQSAKRELIAVDASANNIIVGNVFKNMDFGGIFIYRNCGEGGTVRHQKPSGNVIRNNIFYHQSGESINVGSRKGNRSYCPNDSGYTFGSSINDLDFAENTTIQNNKFYMNYKKQNFFSRYIISSSEPSTNIINNQAFVETNRDYGFKERIFGKFIDGGVNDISLPKKAK